MKRIPTEVFFNMRILTMLALSAALVPSMLAQSTGGLVGTVKDSSGGVVPGATVSVYRLGMTEPAVQTTTSGLGSFAFNALPPESYTVKVEKQGFQPAQLTGVTLAPSTETPVNIVLQPGGPATPTTTVTSQVTPSLQTSDAEVSTTLSSEQLDALPFLNRDPLSLVATQAGVVSGAADGGFTTIDGLRTSFSNVTLDGINVQDNTVRYNGLDVVANNLVLGQVDQFTLVTSNQSTIYGNGVTQAAFVSPAGSNQVHGSAFYQNSNDLSNANTWFQNSQGLKDAYKTNQAGFTLGGPLIKDKLFGYLDYEFLRQRNTIGYNVNEGITLYNQTTGQNNTAPFPAWYQVFQSALQQQGLQVNPVVAAALSQIPSPNLSDGYTYQHAEGQRNEWDNVTGRLDYVESSKNTFVISYLWNRLDVDTQPSLFGSRYAVTQHSNPTLLSGSWRFVASAHLTNELRAGLNIAPIDFVDQERTVGYYLDLGPFQGLNPVSNYGDQGRKLKTYDFQDNASYVYRQHNIQFGFQAQLLRISNYLENGSVPTVALGTGSFDYYDAAATLLGLSGVWGVVTSPPSPLPAGCFYTYPVEDCIYSFAVAVQNLYPANSTGQFGVVPEQHDLKLDNYAAYIQDSYRINTRLALTWGMRYDYYTVFGDSLGRFYAPDLVNGNVAATLSSGAPTYSPEGGGFYQPSKKDFAPSIGLAIDPFGNGRTVFRAGYGISYVNDDFMEAFRHTLTSNASYLGFVAYALSGPLSTAALQNLNSQVPYPSGGANLPAPTAYAYPVLGLIDPGLRTPYVQQWSAGVQHRIDGIVLDLRYVGNHAIKMLREDEFAAGVDGATTAYYLSNSSSSSYNALQFDVSRRLRSGVQFQANYTFAKVLTDSDTYTSALVDPYLDPSDHRLNWGPAAFDIRHAFKANVIYPLPFGRDGSTPAPMRQLVGGWTVSAIAVAQSGAPFSILSGNDINPSSFPLAGQMASLAAGAPSLGQIVSYHMTGNGPTMILPANDPYFAVPPEGALGTLPPRSFYGPATFDIDLALQKRFRMTERQSLDLRAVAVNALNHPSFGFYNQVVQYSNFGFSAYQAYPSRTMQFSATYRF